MLRSELVMWNKPDFQPGGRCSRPMLHFVSYVSDMFSVVLLFPYVFNLVYVVKVNFRPWLRGLYTNWVVIQIVSKYMNQCIQFCHYFTNYCVTVLSIRYNVQAFISTSFGSYTCFNVPALRTLISLSPHSSDDVMCHRSSQQKNVSFEANAEYKLCAGKTTTWRTTAALLKLCSLTGGAPRCCCCSQADRVGDLCLYLGLLGSTTPSDQVWLSMSNWVCIFSCCILYICFVFNEVAFHRSILDCVPNPKKNFTWKWYRLLLRIADIYVNSQTVFVRHGAKN